MNLKKFSLILLTPLLIVFLAGLVSAHCPLCTIGAAAAAGGAVWLGVSKVVVSLFIGAFAVSIGYWFGNIIKKKYVPFQKTLLIIVSFLLTVIPILPIISYQQPLYISILGSYGSLLNRTYLINLSLISSLVGGGIVLIAPTISRKITDLRDRKMLPFQGILITFLLLIITGGIIQVLI